MERLYGNYQCDVCQRPSQLGWVYLCTQDDVQSPSYGFLSKILQEPTLSLSDQKETFSTTPTRLTYDLSAKSGLRENAPEFQMPTSDLAPWMERAITRGHYAPEQIKVLQAQRQNVVEVANAAIELYEQETTPKDTHFPAYASVSEGMAAKVAVSEREESPPLRKLKMFPYCKFRACQACRPTFRERTWERFENVYDKADSGTNTFECHRSHDTRPLASPKVMRAIGLTGEVHPAPPTHRPRRLRPGSVSDSDIRLHGMNGRLGTRALTCSTRSVPAMDAATPGTGDVADARLELESESTRFRESIMRAFRGVLPRSQSSRSIKKGRIASVSEASVDMASWYGQQDAVLKEAAGVSSPGPESVDRLVADFGDAAEVQLVEGVALTEESADLGAADIITSM